MDAGQVLAGRTIASGASQGFLVLSVTPAWLPREAGFEAGVQCFSDIQWMPAIPCAPPEKPIRIRAVTP
ncbi:MAG: hypothetical protein JW748_14755 [Anaerolineales bacterium]|nr:hypothetical protein [Anaerolineales bacterium]